MRNPLFYQIVFIVSLALYTSPSPGASPTAPIVRLPAFAGVNYPAEPEKLLAMIRGFFDQADTPELSYKLKAVVASAAPYALAGQVSAHAFKILKPGQYERVILLAPGHGPRFEYCSIPAVDLFITPLGPVPMDEEAIRLLLYSPFINAHELRYGRSKINQQIHEYEFAIESLLPYLQERLLEFKLVPVLVGDLRDTDKHVNKRTLLSLAETLRTVINERTLVVVASSFTHYGAEYQNIPFKESIAENIAHLDRRAMECILSLDVDAFRAYLEETGNVIDGAACLQLLMLLLSPESTQARLLAYATSMEATGEANRSVSYAAFQFHDFHLPALPAQPEKVRPLVLGGIPSATVPPEAPSTEPTQTTTVTPDKPASSKSQSVSTPSDKPVHHVPSPKAIHPKKKR